MQNPTWSDSIKLSSFHFFFMTGSHFNEPLADICFHNLPTNIERVNKFKKGLSEQSQKDFEENNTFTVWQYVNQMTTLGTQKLWWSLLIGGPCSEVIYVIKGRIGTSEYGSLLTCGRYLERVVIVILGLTVFCKKINEKMFNS